MKNHDLIITHLNESIHELQRIVICLETGHMFGTRKPMRYRKVHFHSHLEHVQHHINYAWHIRDVPHEQALNASDEEIERWSTFWITGDD